ncbi:MAG: HEAT repeat domain-containing protein [Planctomycetes bacterium]|nr:HEAT repeat domain-containing protein [Planctomycetota bacterium]
MNRRRDLLGCGLMVALFLFLAQGQAWAHGGSYGGPGPGGAGTPGPGPGNPRNGGTTPGTDPSWINWWDRNREEFFDVRKRRLEGSLQGENKRYDRDDVHQLPSRDEVRDQVVPVLQGLLGDKSADVRDAAAIALGRAGEAPVVESLAALLSDGDRSVRQAAVMGLGLVRHPMAEQILIDYMLAQDTAYKERGMAALALGFSGGDKALKALLDRLGETQPFTRLAAIKTRQVDGCRALGLGLAGAASAAGPLIQAVQKDRSKDRAFNPLALTGLAKLADPGAGSTVLAGLDARHNDDRRAAAIAAGRCLGRDDPKVLKKLLTTWKEEKDAHARYFLTISLGRIGGDEILAALRKNLDRNRNREDRAFTALALGIAGDLDSAATLLGLLEKEKDISLRGAAAIALGILGDANAAPALMKTLADTANPELRSFVITALAMLDHREALPSIRDILARSARDERLGRACGLALAVMFEADSLELMMTIMRNSGSIQVKGGMATALGRAGDRRSIEGLVKLATDGGETDLTRAFAVVALGLVADKSPSSDFARAAIDSNYAMENAEALLEVIDIF